MQTPTSIASCRNETLRVHLKGNITFENVKKIETEVIKLLQHSQVRCAYLDLSAIQQIDHHLFSLMNNLNQFCDLHQVKLEFSIPVKIIVTLFNLHHRRFGIDASIHNN